MTEKKSIKGSINRLDTYHTDAYMIAVKNGFDGTEEEWLRSLKGAKIVSTAFQGKDSDGGNVYLQTFDNGVTSTFTAPKGDKGDTGATGRQGEKGEKGDKGDPGGTVDTENLVSKEDHDADIAEINEKIDSMFGSYVTDIDALIGGGV